MPQKSKEMVSVRNKTATRIDINSHLPGVEPKTITVRGRLELGPEHFEGYHYKCLTKTGGPLREVRRFEVKVPLPKPVEKPKADPPKAKHKKTASKRGQDSREVESGKKRFINLSGDPASGLKDGV